MQDPKKLIATSPLLPHVLPQLLLQLMKSPFRIGQFPKTNNRFLMRMAGAGAVALMLAALSSTPTFAKSVPVQAFKPQNTVSQASSNQASSNQAAGDQERDWVNQGVVIVSVDPEGPAAGAGIVRGDILLKVENSSVDSTAALYSVVVGSKPGDEVDVVVLHGDEERSVSVTLAQVDERAYLGVQVVDAPVVSGASSEDVTVTVVPSVAVATETSGVTTANTETVVIASSGATAVAADATTVTVMPARPAHESVVVVSRGDGAGTYVMTMGLLVDEVMADGPAAGAGIVVGDLITAIDGQSIASVDEFVAVLATKIPGQEIRLLVYRVTPTEAVTEEVVVTLGASPDDAARAYLGVRFGGGVASVSVEAAPSVAVVPVAPAQMYAAPAMPVVPSAVASATHCGDVVIYQDGAPSFSALPTDTIISPRIYAQPVMPPVPFFINDQVQVGVYGETSAALPVDVLSVTTMAVPAAAPTAVSAPFGVTSIYAGQVVDGQGVTMTKPEAIEIQVVPVTNAPVVPAPAFGDVNVWY